MGAIRRARHARPRSTRAEITPRVVRVLVIIGRLGVASVARHIAVLEFPDTSTAHRFLARCFALGLVAIEVPHLNAQNLAVLTSKGRRVAVEHGADIDSLHVVRRLGSGVAHLLLGNDVRVAIAVAARKRTDIVIDEIVSDLDVRRWLGVRARVRDAVIPDLLVRLTTPAGELRLAFEIDLSSERSAQWRGKVRSFVALYRAGADLAGVPHPWRPVLVTPEGSRLRTLARIVVEEGAGDLWAGGLAADVVRDPFGPHYASLATIARTSPDRPLPLRDYIVPPAADER